MLLSQDSAKSLKITIFVTFSPHRMNSIDAAYWKDVTRSVVCLSVC